MNSYSLSPPLSLSDVAEELRLPAASRRPHVRPAAGEGHAVGRGRHAALLRHSCDGNPGPDDHRVSQCDGVCVCVVTPAVLNNSDGNMFHRLTVLT